MTGQFDDVLFFESAGIQLTSVELRILGYEIIYIRSCMVIIGKTLITCMQDTEIESEPDGRKRPGDRPPPSGLSNPFSA